MRKSILLLMYLTFMPGFAMAETEKPVRKTGYFRDYLPPNKHTTQSEISDLRDGRYLFKCFRENDLHPSDNEVSLLLSGDSENVRKIPKDGSFVSFPIMRPAGGRDFVTILKRDGENANQHVVVGCYYVYM